MSRVLLFIVVVCCLNRALSPCSAQTKRVRPPAWKSIDVNNVFFLDAFNEALQGERPVHLSSGSAIASSSSQIGDAAAGADSVDHGERKSSATWSKVISTATIENEIKRISSQLNDSVSQPTIFASGGYQQARRQFSVLAALFAMIHEYDGDLRWRSSAEAARDRFAYAASLAKVGTVQVFNVATQSKSELDDLIRGEPIADETADRGAWIGLLDRGPLMQRMERAHQGVIEPALASSAAMKSQREALVHEAEIAAALAQILLAEGMDEWDDQQYVEYCNDLKRAAAAMIQAVRDRDYPAAVQASGRMSKSCSHCHETFRG